MNRCNDADFRIVILGGELELTINNVEVTKIEPSGEKK
jgi:hypothetical protein